jgi:uncharacterized membrane protein YqaE (UPF0057 family)
MSDNRDRLEIKIDNMEWTLYDRFMYGGLGYGYFCFPSNLVKIICTVIFPPLGTILKHAKISDKFPYITYETLSNLFDNINDIIYCFILTAMFYIPGLIYGLSGLKCTATHGEEGDDFKDLTMDDIKDHFSDIREKKKIKKKISAQS